MFGANSPELTKMLLEELEKEKKALEGLITREVVSKQIMKNILFKH